jgi:predicted nicotinamide N-methyase
MRLRQRLLARIRRQFDIIEQTYPMGPLQLQFTRVKDPDRVLDQVAEAEDQRERTRGSRLDADELHLPYWAELWDSATAMGHFLAEGAGRELVRPDMAVLDLGCGMGFPGSTAAALGARVLLADIEPAALLFAALNSLRWRERVRIRRINWRRDQLDERFELILGADILYERAQWEHLEPFWRHHLADGGLVLLGEPGRQTGDAFPDWIEKQGWTLVVREQPVSTRQRPVRIFELRRTIRGGKSSGAEAKMP